jgi:hypothetical protein
MEFKVIRSGSIEALNIKIEAHIIEGWEPVGGHQVVVSHVQNRFSGLQHKDTVYSHDYSISMLKK